MRRGCKISPFSELVDGYDRDILMGELRVMYESNDENYAVRGRRAYIFAFRIRDNYRAIHMYQTLGFNKFVLRKQEEYQGDRYEYNLYLKR